jgi:hypothetical protein
VRAETWPGAAAYPNFPVDRGLTFAAIESRASVVSNDVEHDARYLTNQDSTGSELIVPVIVDETIVGSLDVEDAQTDTFEDRDIAFFKSVAAALASLYVEPISSAREIRHAGRQSCQEILISLTFLVLRILRCCIHCQRLETGVLLLRRAPRPYLLPG